MTTPHGALVRAAHALHLSALGLWAGTIAMTGVAAAVIFPTMKALAPRLPVYSAVPEEGHWLLAAGRIAARIFSIGDAVQLACAVVTLVTAVLLARTHGIGRSITAKCRVGALVGAWGLLTFSLAILQPRMTAHLHEHWRLSEAGQLTEAEAHADAFRADHPTSSRVLGATALCTLAALLLGAGAPDRAAVRKVAA